MAKIVSPVWSTIRGSIAGTTYFPNQYGQIIARQRTTPVQPGTLRQEQVRGSFAMVADEWRSLTSAQRKDWDDYAATCGFQGAQGYYHIPGREMFVRNITTANYVRVRGLYTSDIDTLAPDWNFWGCGLSEVVPPPAGNTGFGIKVYFSDAADGLIYSFRSRAIHPSRNFWKGPYDTESINGIVAITGTSPVTFNYLGLVEDAKYFFIYHGMQQEGDPSKIRLSVAFRGDAIAVTVP